MKLEADFQESCKSKRGPGGGGGSDLVVAAVLRWQSCKGLAHLYLQAKGWWTCRQRFSADLKFHPGVEGVPQDHEGLLAAVEGFIVLGTPDKHPRS